jgi:hypothetical protein
MHREKAGVQAQLQVLLKLARRHELRVDDHRAVVLLRLESSAAAGLEHQVDGGIAIAVRKQLVWDPGELRAKSLELLQD